jgi:hypothetical protein
MDGMKKQEKAAMLTKAVVLAAAFSVLPFPLSVRADALAAAESGEESGRENSGQEEDQSEPAVPRNQWTYQAEGNVWYYYGRDQERVRGRQLIHGETYFFDEEGKMLTGWVASGDKIGDSAEIYHSGGVDDSVYYCDTTGKMCRKQWMPAYAPDSPYFEVFSGPAQDADENVNWYYFDEKGHPYQNKKLTYEGNDYYFDEEGVRLSGWVYEDDRDEKVRYVKVTDETEDAWGGWVGENDYAENYYAHNPQNYIYCDPDSGAASKSCWITAKPPGKDEGEDDRSFYCGKDGHIVTQYRYGFSRDAGDWEVYEDKFHPAIVADNIKPWKVENDKIGTYAFNGAPGSDKADDGYVGFIFKADDGRYYICENNGARIDGLFLITKRSDSILTKFPNGFYDFSDNAAMVTGPRVKTSEYGNEDFYYYFSEKTDDKNYRGRGVTGVYDGKLYYQGLAVGASGTERYELVYVPEIANRDGDATGLFLVDAEGNVKTGSAQKVSQKGVLSGGKKYKDYGGYTYRVCKPERGNGKNGYDIYLIDKADEIDKDPGQRLGADDAVYVYLKEAEE